MGPYQDSLMKVLKKHQGQRLDLFLAEQQKISRKKAKLLIDQGKVFIGPRKVIIASWEVQEGDEIKIQDSAEAPLPRRERYLKIYYEDADLLVVEKPPGVACEKTAQTLSSTLVDDINDYLKRAHPDIPYPYVGLMHRLDRQTSGVMVYTLSKRANVLSDQFKGHRLARSYLALVEGRIKQDEGVIDRAIVKDMEASGKKMKALPANKSAGSTRSVTRYRVVELYGKTTLVEAMLETGRTHQVRVHLAALGHPIVGDTTYGSKIPAPRHALHAAYLEFRHPLSHKKMSFRSKPPKDFENLMERYRADAVGMQYRRPEKGKIAQRKQLKDSQQKG